MRTLVALAALLPACLIAPGPPGGPPPDGGGFRTSGCLPVTWPLAHAAVGRNAIEDDLILRTGLDPTSMLPTLFLFEPAAPSPECFRQAVTPKHATPAQRIVALDASLDGATLDVVLMLEGDGGLAFVEVRAAPDGSLSETSDVAAPGAAIVPSSIEVKDDSNGATPRFVRRLSPGLLWFGGGSTVGQIREVSHGVLGAPELDPVVTTAADSERWLDAIPGSTPDTASLVGEDSTCPTSSMPHELDCSTPTQNFRGGACALGTNCWRRTAHVTRELGDVAGFTYAQPAAEALVEILSPSLVPDELVLEAPVDDDLWDVAVGQFGQPSGTHAIVTVWDDSLGDPELVTYSAIGATSSKQQELPLSLITPGWVLVAKRGGSERAILLGHVAGERQCFALDSALHATLCP